MNLPLVYVSIPESITRNQVLFTHICCVYTISLTHIPTWSHDLNLTLVWTLPTWIPSSNLPTQLYWWIFSCWQQHLTIGGHCYGNIHLCCNIMPTLYGLASWCESDLNLNPDVSQDLDAEESKGLRVSPFCVSLTSSTALFISLNLNGCYWR